MEWGKFGGFTEELLKHISTQIVELAKHVDKRFDRIESALIVMNKHILEGFSQIHLHLNSINNLISNFYLDSMRQFREIKEGIEKLNSAINNIGPKLDHVISQINDLRDNLNIVAMDIYNQPYNDMKSRAKNLYQIYGYQKNSELLLVEARSLLINFTRWAVVEAKVKTLSGGYQTHVNINNLCTNISEKGIELHINTLVAYLNEHHHMHLQPVVNPIVWQDAVQSYIDLVYRTPKLPINTDNIAHINEMLDAGKHLKNTILAIKCNEKLFHNLCENYRECVKNLVTIIYNNELTANMDSLNFINAQIKDKKIELFSYLDSISDVLRNYHSISGNLNNARQSLDQLLNDSNINPTDTLKVIHLLDDMKENLIHLWGYNWIANDYDGYQPPVPIWGKIVNGLFKAGLQTGGALEFRRVSMNTRPEPIINNIIPVLKFMIIAKSSALSINNTNLEPSNRPAHLLLMKEFFKNIDPLTFNMQISKEIKDGNLKIALENLNNAHRLLTIFISLAFPIEYAHDPVLKNYLQTELWDGEVIENYVEKATQSSDFVSFVIERNVLDAIDACEDFLINKVLESRIKQNVDYSLLNDTLETLNTFKDSCEGYSLIQNGSQEYSKFREKLAELNKKCIFKVIRENETRITINLTNRNKILGIKEEALRDLLSGIGGVLQDDLATTIGKVLDMEIAEPYKLIISCTNTMEADKVAEILTQLVKEYSKIKPTTAEFRNLFFSSASTTHANPEIVVTTMTENEHSINCAIQ